MAISSRVDLIDYAKSSTHVFVSNKYFDTYMRLMQKAMDRGWEKKTCENYVERHHLLPKSIFPEFIKTKENIVCLTAREHFVAHLLLTKCTTTHFSHKMTLAIQKILFGNDQLYIKSSHLYEQLKIKISEACSIRTSLYWSKLSKEERSVSRSKGNDHWHHRNRGTKALKEIGKKISETKRLTGSSVGKNNAMYGRTHSQESLKLMSEKAKLRSLRNKEKKAYHSPIENKFAYFNLDKQPEGWILGRGKIIREIK